MERYLFRIGVLLDQPLPYIFDEIAGFELMEMGGFDAVLGMAVLRRCDFHMHRDGRCELRFA